MPETIDDGPTPDDGISEDQVPVVEVGDDTSLLFDGDIDDYAEDEPPEEAEGDKHDPEAVG